MIICHTVQCNVEIFAPENKIKLLCLDSAYDPRSSASDLHHVEATEDISPRGDDWIYHQSLKSVHY